MHACARVCIFAKLFGEFNVAIGTWVVPLQCGLASARRERVQHECVFAKVCVHLVSSRDGGR